MKDFRSQYYIDNVPWQRKIDYSNIKKFKNIEYNQNIVFHFDFMYSIFKLSKNNYQYDKTIFVSAINACLRYYQIIKKFYPYNKVFVIIHLKKKNSFCLDCETFETVTNLIPNFAVYDGEDAKFDNKNYKHIFYGLCNNIKSKMKNSEIQSWNTVQGNLIIN